MSGFVIWAALIAVGVGYLVYEHNKTEQKKQDRLTGPEASTWERVYESDRRKTEQYKEYAMMAAGGGLLLIAVLLMLGGSGGGGGEVCDWQRCR